MYQPHEMSNESLLEELDYQNEWAAMDAGESAFFGRGDGGLKRSNYIAALYAEAVKRGLKKPLPLLPEQTAEFPAVCEAMARLDYKWGGHHFSQWGSEGSWIASISFEDAKILVQEQGIPA